VPPNEKKQRLTVLDGNVRDKEFTELSDSQGISTSTPYLVCTPSHRLLGRPCLRSVMVDLGRKFQKMCYGEDDDVCARFSKLTYLREQSIARVYEGVAHHGEDTLTSGPHRTKAVISLPITCINIRPAPGLSELEMGGSVA